MAAWTQQWTRLDRRQRRLVLVLGVVLAGGVVDLTILRPLQTYLKQLNRDVRDTEQRLKEALVAASQVDAVNAAFEGYRPYLSARGSPEAELAAVLTEVEAAVRDAGMLLLSLRPTGQIGAEAVSVSVDGEATPGQLVRFLDRLQRSTQLLKVTELSIRVSEDRTLRSSLVVSKLLL